MKTTIDHPAAGMEEVDFGFDYMRVREWAKSTPRRAPAQLAFTAGSTRNVAYLIEELFPDVGNMVDSSGWQKIETAPKDGTPIILIRSGKNTISGEDYIPVILSWIGDCWGDIESDDDYSGWEPTHWMPLPQPPQEQK